MKRDSQGKAVYYHNEKKGNMSKIGRFVNMARTLASIMNGGYIQFKK